MRSWLALGLYRMSGRRLMRSRQLYRTGVAWQRRNAHHFPGMTSADERAYFKWHAQEVFAGRGEVVDLGSWFGSTTATLAMGLQRNPHPNARAKRVHAYDRFIWEPWMNAYEGDARFGPYPPGDSFLREFELTVRPWRERIEVHTGDLLEERWTGPPIELLLVDAMKAWDLTAHIVREFYAPLEPDDGYVIHQDFGNCYTPWIHLTTHALRPGLRPAFDVPGSETVVFRVTEPLQRIVAEAPVNRADFGDREVEQAFDYSLSVSRPEKHSGIFGARVMLSVYDGDLEAAEALLGRYCVAKQLSPSHEMAVREAIARARQAGG